MVFRTDTAAMAAFVLFTVLGGTSASAQQPQDVAGDQTPSFVSTSIESIEEPAVPPAPTLKPLAPPPVTVLEIAAEARASTGPAEITPPSPKIVTRGEGVVLIPGKRQFAAGGFTSQNAAATNLVVNSGFGYRRDPFSRRGRMHTGVDLKAHYGETVGASLSGSVAFAGVKRGYGNIVILDHGSGISTYYAHLSAISVGVGQPVDAGQIIGLVGSTGRSTSPHLHYELRANGHPLNPFATVAIEGQKVFVDGQLLSAPAAVEDWGDEAESAPSKPSVSTRPRRVAADARPDKKILIYGEDSLTQY